MQTKKVVFFVLLATVLLSVSQVFLATAHAMPVNNADRKNGIESQNGTTDTCTPLNLSDPQQSALYNALLSGQAGANSTSTYCTP